MIQKTITISEELDSEITKISNENNQNYSNVLRTTLEYGLLVPYTLLSTLRVLKVIEGYQKPFKATDILRESYLGDEITYLKKLGFIETGRDKIGDLWIRNAKSYFIDMNENTIQWE